MVKQERMRPPVAGRRTGWVVGMAVLAGEGGFDGLFVGTAVAPFTGVDVAWGTGVGGAVGLTGGGVGGAGGLVGGGVD